MLLDAFIQRQHQFRAIAAQLPPERGRPFSWSDAQPASRAWSTARRETPKTSLAKHWRV
jgi:hypothetical protein